MKHIRGLKQLKTVLAISAIILACIPVQTWAAGFSWPVDCTPGINCDGKKTRIGFPDLEGVGIAHSCGPAGYTGHLGTDIMVSSVEQNVQVLAAADGVVRWQEDGLYDHCPNSSNWQCNEQRKSFLHIDATTEASLGFNAGNYIVLEHVTETGRYLTLYAHLKKGSMRVSQGQRVSRGDTLATVASSGNSLTPHLHFGVFQQAGNVYKPVDPWKGPCNSTSNGLWASNPPYPSESIAKTLTGSTAESVHLVKAQQTTSQITHKQ